MRIIPPITVSMSLARITRATQSGIIPFTASMTAARLTRSLSAKKSMMERICEGYLLDMKFSKKPTNAVRMKIRRAMPLLFNARDMATTTASTHLSHVIVENIFSFLILSFISLLPAYVYKRRRHVQRDKFPAYFAEMLFKQPAQAVCVLEEDKFSFIA